MSVHFRCSEGLFGVNIKLFWFELLLGPWCCGLCFFAHMTVHAVLNLIIAKPAPTFQPRRLKLGVLVYHVRLQGILTHLLPDAGIQPPCFGLDIIVDIII